MRHGNKSGRISSPGDKYPCYLLHLDSALYIGQFDYYIQAFCHWRLLPERERWLIVGTEDALRIVKHAGLRGRKYLKYDEPRPLKRHYNARNRKGMSFKRGADGKFVA